LLYVLKIRTTRGLEPRAILATSVIQYCRALRRCYSCLICGTFAFASSHVVSVNCSPHYCGTCIALLRFFSGHSGTPFVTPMLFARLWQVLPVAPNLATNWLPNVVGYLRACSRRVVAFALTLFWLSQ